MKSATTKRFWRRFEGLPSGVQQSAIAAFEHWKADPSHPGVRFKPVHGFEGVYSVRMGDNWRALGRLKGDTIYWFWIGSHADYDAYLSRR